METSWSTALWRQFGAAIDMLENALVACPAALWTQRLWRDPPPPEFPPQFAEFWYVTFHALVDRGRLFGIRRRPRAAPRARAARSAGRYTKGEE